MLSENKFPCDILMVRPDNFRIEYKINPYMTDENGDLKDVDQSKSVAQWDALLSAFVGLNLKVKTLESHEDYPDMIFVANQSFPFLSNEGPALLMSKMYSPQRQGEVPYIQNWAQDHGLKIFEFESDLNLEGTGDMIWDPYNKKVFGGYGYRTDLSVYNEVEKIIDRQVIRLQLTTPNFYHLDTCFSVLNKDTVLAVDEAFDDESNQRIRSHFKNIISISGKEARETFVGNCFCPDGKNIVTHPLYKETKNKLEKLGFNIIEVDTSEYMKAGGSVFCLKLALMHAC